jgi:hypothetical protein
MIFVMLILHLHSETHSNISIVVGVASGCSLWNKDWISHSGMAFQFLFTMKHLQPQEMIHSESIKPQACIQPITRWNWQSFSILCLCSRRLQPLPYTLTGAWRTKKRIYSHGNSHALFVLIGLREGIMAHKPISQNFACDMLLAVT